MCLLSCHISVLFLETTGPNETKHGRIATLMTLLNLEIQHGCLVPILLSEYILLINHICYAIFA